MVKRFFLIEMEHGEGNGPTLDSIQTTLKVQYHPDCLNVSEIKDSDFVVEEDKPASVELGRRRINLRRPGKTIEAGVLCKVKKLPNSPEMVIELIRKDSINGKECDVARCIWFNNGTLNRAAVIIDSLELVKEESKSSTDLPIS
jgi:hypothetical protein